jgi:tRNA (guanine9-N1)-methyltransferase
VLLSREIFVEASIMEQEQQKQPLTTITQAEEKPTIRNFKGIEYDITNPKFQNLSKRAIKKLLRDEQWDATKDERRSMQREKIRVKRLEKRRMVRQGLLEATPTKKKLAFLSELTNVGLIMDCGFNDLMTEKVASSFQYCCFLLY